MRYRALNGLAGKTSAPEKKYRCARAWNEIISLVADVSPPLLSPHLPLNSRKGLLGIVGSAFDAIRFRDSRAAFHAQDVELLQVDLRKIGYIIRTRSVGNTAGSV